MPPAQSNMALSVLVMAALIAVAFFNTLIEKIQASISIMGFDRGNTLSSKVIAYFCVTVPYLWLAIVLSVPTAACAYLKHEMHRSKHSENQVRSGLKRQLSKTVLQAYRSLNQRDDYYQKYQDALRERDDYRQRYEDAAHANFDTQKRVAAMKCSRGKTFISTENFGSHTCCNDAAKLRRRVTLLETEAQNERRFRKAPVDMGTISDIAADMAQFPERWWPVLHNLLPSLMARVRAVPGAHQSQDMSLQATVQFLGSQVQIQAATNEGLHKTIQEDAKKASDMRGQCETLQNLNTEDSATIRSLRIELENKASIIKELEDNKETSGAAEKSQGAEVGKTQVTNANCTHCKESAETLQECKAVLQVKSEQIETLTRKDESLSSLLSEEGDKLNELERQLHESNARVIELESRDLVTEKLQNQTATQSEEIERLKEDNSGLERKLKSKTVRFASPETLLPSESASAETALRQQAMEKDARISDLTQTVNEFQTAQSLADVEFGRCKAVVTQAEQVARTALGPGFEASSILELVQELGTRLERTKVEFAALEEIAPIESGIGSVIRSKFLQLVGEGKQLYEEKLTVELELQQEINNRDDEIRRLMGQAGTVNNSGPELASALARIAELEKQKTEATAARHTAIGLQAQMAAQIARQTQEIADVKQTDKDLQRNFDEQVALLARLMSESDMFIDFLNTYKIGLESDPFTLRLRRLNEKYKGLESTKGDSAKDLQDVWNVLDGYKLTIVDKQGTLFPRVLDCVSTLVAQVVEAQIEVNKVFRDDGSYDPEVHNIARRVHKLREDRDMAVGCLNKDRDSLTIAYDELKQLRKQIKKLRNTEPNRQTAIISQESTMSSTESEAAPPGQRSSTKRRADESDAVDSAATERRAQSRGKKPRLAQGEEENEKAQGEDIKMMEEGRTEESSGTQK
ncbi:hypothetical protein LTR70_001438 [Exophiala xenobiotica]|uniref:Uncharacterized protein n=1 Tax=Lithohypha guttulata TaxID=1690604 RepID=A0ABR0KIU1_9EURO|nr:hypothetical protein LTR24_002728 [Lithohypha guttulata]KAK5327815.1 hypothetical protein LTR70_001438 [Exophiala xenobiotica]